MALTCTSVHATRWTTSSVAGSITGISWNAGDIIVYFGGLFKSSGGVGTLTPSNANLTFSRHIARNNGGTLSTDYWAAIATSSQSGQTIAVSQSVGSSQGSQTLHVISGGVTGFDSDASIPAGTNSPVQTSPSINTTQRNTLVYLNAFQASTATRCGVPSGWTASGGIGPSTSAGGTTPCFKLFTGAQTGLTATYSGGSVQELIDVDAYTSDELVTVDQTFQNISQEIDVIEAGSPVADIDQTFFNISQSLSAHDDASGTIDQTLPLITQSLSAKEIVTSAISTLAPGLVQQLIVVTEIEISQVSSTFFPMEQALTASVGAANHITQTLPGLLQEAIVVNEIEITSLNQTLPGALQQVLDCDQTPPTIIRQTLPGVLVQQFDAVVEDQTFIDMTFISMNNYPRFAEIDMTLGGSGGEAGGGGTYRTWWRPSCGP